MVGPTIQQDLILTLLSFRLYRHALTADITKTYRQFIVDPQDRKFQLICWRHNISDPLKLYQLNTVTYGLACAPFLAIRSLHFIAEKYRKEFSIGSEIISNEMYVDDLLTGADCIEDLKLKVDKNTGILSCAGLELAKWNFSKLDDNIKEHRFKLDSKDITKTLGMSWRPQVDEFSFQFDLPKTNAMSKRNILSIIARLYDILGLLGPVVTRCKIFVQELWMSHLDWDEILPQQLIDRWQSIYPDLHNLNQIGIPRYRTFPET